MDQFTSAILWGLASYIFYGVCMYSIAVKLGFKDIAIYAFIPLANIYLLFEMARLPLYLMAPYILRIFFGIGIVGIILNILAVTATVLVFMNLAHYRGFSKWLGLLILVPLVNIVFIIFLAFSDRKPRGKKNEFNIQI